MYKWIFSFLCLLLLQSCNTEKKLALEYAADANHPAVLLLYPDFLYKNNRELNKIKDFDKLPKAVKDSIWLEKSHYLKYITDSVFIDNFVHSFSNELEHYGIKIYHSVDLNSFLKSDSSAFFVNIAQMQMEEYKFTYTDSEIFDDTTEYYKSLRLNGVDINVWFEVNPLNDSSGSQKLLFAGQTYTDHLKGRFRKQPLSGDVHYKYTVNTLKVDDVMNASTILGAKYASWVFDYLMNSYLWRILNRHDFYFHYNRFKNRIENAYHARLVPVDN